MGIDTNSQKKKNGVIILYDNETGEKINEFRLTLSLDEVMIVLSRINCQQLVQQMADYSVVMDLDTIVITSKLMGSNKFECHIYRMNRDFDIESQKY